SQPSAMCSVRSNTQKLLPHFGGPQTTISPSRGSSPLTRKGGSVRRVISRNRTGANRRWASPSLRGRMAPLPVARGTSAPLSKAVRPLSGGIAQAQLFGDQYPRRWPGSRENTPQLGRMRGVFSDHTTETGSQNPILIDWRTREEHQSGAAGLKPA